MHGRVGRIAVARDTHEVCAGCRGRVDQIAVQGATGVVVGGESTAAGIEQPHVAVERGRSSERSRVDVDHKLLTGSEAHSVEVDILGPVAIVADSAG